jgi:hypothetical protein
LLASKRMSIKAPANTLVIKKKKKLIMRNSNEESFSAKNFNTVENGCDGNCGAMRLFDECKYQHLSV